MDDCILKFIATMLLLLDFVAIYLAFDMSKGSKRFSEILISVFMWGFVLSITLGIFLIFSYVVLNINMLR